MAKGRVKRSHLKKYSAANVSVPKTFDPNKKAAFDIFSRRAQVQTKENPTVVFEEFKVGNKTFVERKQIVRWGQDTHLKKRDQGAFKGMKERTNQVTYLSEVPPTRGLQETCVDPEGPRPKAAVVNALHAVWQSDRRQGIDTFNLSVVLFQHKLFRIRMFHGVGDKVVFLKEYETLLLKSDVYPTRARGMLALERNQVTWTIHDP